MNKLRWVLVLSALVGALAGLAAPKAARATTINVELRVYGGATSLMTCGWHTECGSSASAGNALDWDNGDEATVLWRSKASRSDGVSGVVASGKTNHTSSPDNCNVMEVQVKDAFLFDKGTAEHHHTASWVPGNSFSIYASGSWQYSERYVGFSVVGEYWPCSFFGSHDHQIQGPQWWWVRQGQSGSYPNCDGYYPNYTCRYSPYYPKPNFLDLNNWQFKQSWTWVF